MIRINDRLLTEVSMEAKSSVRQRKNFNFHKEPGDRLQRLLNAIEPWSYIRPHKHESPDKREIFFVLRGKIALVEFDDHGIVTDFVVLGPETGNYAAEIAERRWHTLISLVPGSVAYEFKDGPYDPIDDKNFAPWAPAEGGPGVRTYLEYLLNLLHLTVEDTSSGQQE